MTLPDELWLDPLDGDDLVIYDRAVDKQYVRYTRADAAPNVDVSQLKLTAAVSVSPDEDFSMRDITILRQTIDYIAAHYTLTPKHAEGVKP